MALARSGLRRFQRAQPPAEGGPGFGELFGSLPFPVLVLDPDGCVAHANAAAEHMLNLSERAMRGSALDALMELPEGYAEREAGRGFAAFDIELKLVRAGRVRGDFVETMATDHPGWRVVSLRHTGPARRASVGPERPLGARAAVGAAAMLAHEIKNPLSGIRGAAQLLAAPDTDAESQTELTRLITAEVDRITALIDRMEDFTDTRLPDIRPTNLYPLLAHVRGIATAGFAREIALEERFDPSLPPALLDRDAFVQVMVNLLKNAAEAVAGHPAPRIVLATAYRHGMSASAGPGRARMPLPIEVVVMDNGPGAPPDIADHLFEPFVSGKPEGKGLGLPLVEKLVGQMGGIVQYSREGEPEQTVFRVLLPRARNV